MTTKRITAIVLSILMMMSVALSTTISAFAANATTVSVIGTYGQTDARKMTSAVNSFRAGKDAWYWNSNNKTKHTCSGLKSLTYDYDLERVAMQRAAEIAVVWSHTRPNGQSCFTAYNYNSSTMGENIAAGSSTWEATLKQWREDDDNYVGQGHRRSMLSNQFTAIGIAHFVCNGVHYWVQEFAASTHNTKATTANNSNTAVPVCITNTAITGATLQLASSNVNATAGKAVALPSATCMLTVANHWPSGRAIPVKVTPAWTVSNTSVATVSGNNVTGKKAGTATLTAKATFGARAATATAMLKVTGNASSGDPETQPTPTPTPTAKTGWVTQNGKQYFYRNGVMLKYRQVINGKLYYFNGAGVLQTGWIKGNNTFFADANGMLKTGWQRINGKRYYFNADGNMAKYTKTIDGKTYYFNGAGVMHTGWLKFNDGNWRYFDSSGAMVRYTKTIGDKTYYFNGQGVMHTGWLKYNNGNWCYFDSNGAMLKNTTRKIGNKTYRFLPSGVCTNK